MTIAEQTTSTRSEPAVSRLMFQLRHAARLGDLAPDGTPFKIEDVELLLEEAERFSREQLRPLNRVGDLVGVAFEDGHVTMPTGWSDAYRRWVDAGWNTLSFSSELGGGGLPFSVECAVNEFFAADNIVFATTSQLTRGAAELLSTWAAPESPAAAWVPRLVTGEWAGTMNLTEPDAGSDVGALRTRAIEQPDGTYKVVGTKIFITFGDHDLTDNIVHLVLARREGAPAGTAGISCFAVPKYLDRDGPRTPNDLTIVSVERKLGLHAMPTCVISYGDNGGATGWLVGEAERGMRCMFTMMNTLRLATGQQGIALADRAITMATDYARTRRQGRPIDSGDSTPYPAPIIEHPDLRRMLTEGRATIEAMRALVFDAAGWLDRSRHATSAEEREAAGQRLALLTPAVKGWCAEVGVRLCSDAIQVFGGMGYIEETGVAQLWRDARSAPIYEGTTAIQAQDLVFRKLGGAGYSAHMDDARATATRLHAIDQQAAGHLSDLITALETASATMRQRLAEDLRAAALSCTSYLELFASVAGAAALAGATVHATANGDPANDTVGLLKTFLRISTAQAAALVGRIDEPGDPFTVAL